MCICRVKKDIMIIRKNHFHFQWKIFFCWIAAVFKHCIILSEKAIIILVPRGFHAQRPVSLRDPDETHLIRFYGPLLSRQPSVFLFFSLLNRLAALIINSSPASPSFVSPFSLVVSFFYLPSDFDCYIPTEVIRETQNSRKNVRSGQMNTDMVIYLGIII